MSIKKFFLFLSLVTLLALILRFNHLLAIYPFTMDEAYQAFLAQNMRQTGHLPLIGVNIADTGLYLGPLFTYLSFILYWLSQGSPISTAIAAPIIGGLTVFSLGWVVYQLTKQLKLKQPAAISLIASLFYAVSPLIVAYDKKFWNPSFLPLLGVWGFYSLAQIYLKQFQGFLLLALLTGLAWHTHISFFAFSLLGLVILLLPQFRPPKKVILQSLIILFLFFFPSILFEFRHQFIQLKGFKQYLTQPSGLTFNFLPLFTWLSFLSRSLYLPGKDLAAEISLCQELLRSLNIFISTILSILLLALIFTSQTFKKIKPLLKLISWLLLAFLLTSLFLKDSVSEYYFLSLLPLMALLVGLAFASSKSSLIQLLIISYLVILSFQSFNLINTYGLSGKIALINRTAKIIGQEPYELLASDNNCRRYEGYGYLFSHYFKPPTSSYMDPFFSWLYTDTDIRTATQQVMLMPGPEVVIQPK